MKGSPRENRATGAVLFQHRMLFSSLSDATIETENDPCKKVLTNQKKF
jgi:hypothetical protein